MKDSNIKYILEESLIKILIISLIFIYSYIFIIATPKLSLVKVSNLLLSPFSLFIPKKDLFTIQYNVMNITPLILSSTKNLFVEHFSSKKNFLNYLNIISPINSLFYENLTHLPYKDISDRKIDKMLACQKPKLKEVLITILLAGAAIGTCYL
ncbi:MAG: hypothetical protein K6348_05140 [Deferribacterales bacterium]